MSALDKLLYRLATVSAGGVPVSVPNPTATQQSPTPPTNINFTNAAAVYNPATNSYDVTTSAAGSGGQNTTTVGNGINSNVATNNLGTLRLTGPTAAFSIGGFALPGGATPAAGQTLEVINTTTQPLTIVPDDASSTNIYRIDTQRGIPVLLPSGRTGTVTFIYDGTTSLWVLQNPGLVTLPSVNIADFGIVGDNATDNATQYAALVSYLSSAGGGQVHVPPGTYISSTVLDLPSNTTLQGLGNGTTFARTGAGTVLSTTSATSVAVRNVTVQAIASDTNSNGVLLTTSTSCEVTGCRIVGFGGNGVKSVGGAGHLISGNTIDGTGAVVVPQTNGVYLNNVVSSDQTINTGYRVIGNDISNTGQGIAGGEIHGASIVGNVIHDITHGVLASGSQHGMYLAGDDLTIVGNQVRRFNGSGIKLLRGIAGDQINCVITGNEIDGGWDGSNILGSSSGLDINGPSSGGSFGFARGFVISGNSVANMHGYSIYLGAEHVGTIVSGNHVNNGRSYGIYVNAVDGNSQDVVVRNNTIENVCLGGSGHAIGVVGGGGTFSNITIDDNVCNGVPTNGGATHHVFVDHTTGLFIRRNTFIGSSNADSLHVTNTCSAPFNFWDNYSDNVTAPTIPVAVGSTAPVERNSWNANAGAQAVTGTRDFHQTGLKSLLAGLVAEGFITDSTTTDGDGALTLASGSQTVDVTGLRFLHITAGSGGSSISDFVQAVGSVPHGSILFLTFNDPGSDHTTLHRGNFYLAGATDFVSTNHASIVLNNAPGGVWTEVCRSTTNG